MTSNRFTPALAAGVLGLGLMATVTPAGSAAAQEAGARHAAQAKAFNVSVKVSRRTLNVEGRLVVRGRVTPAVRGGTVRIQKKIVGGSGWKLEKKVTMGSGGRFSYTDHPRTAGVRHYRAVVPGQGGIKGARSKAARVTVYRWIDLAKLQPRAVRNTWRNTGVAINGRHYGASVGGATWAGSDAGFMDWNLDRRCVRLNARVGNGDQSDDTAIATISLIKDGETAYTRSFGLTESEPRALNLVGVFRFRFAWTSSNVEGDAEHQGGAQAVLVLPRARCAF